MNGVKTASVWVEDVKQWIPLSQIIVIQRYNHEGKNCVQFKYEDKILESYVEYKEV
jgi:hypothetical protein